MRFAAAASKFHRMLHVKHLVIEHVGHNAFRHAGMIEPAIDQNLLERRIEAPKLGSPNAFAPAEARLNESAIEMLRIERREERIEIMMCASRPMFRAPRALAAQPKQSRPSGPRIRKLSIRFDQAQRRTPPVKLSKQDRGGGLKHVLRCI